MNNVFTANFKVRFYEGDINGFLKPVTLLNYLQDTASSHSSSQGYSVNDLRGRNATWVLSRYHIRIDRYPSIGEDISVTTWRAAIDGLFVIRDFEISDAGGNALGAATSSWVLLDLETRRPVRVETVIPDLPVTGHRSLKVDFAPLPKLEKWGTELPFRVATQDLDLNGHVNHTIYAGWALESVPPAISLASFPHEIEIVYKAEAVQGDFVLSRSSQAGPDTFHHQIVRGSDGKELTRARTRWHANDAAFFRG
jgi:medium-chain acyl-[acyl-carrier-protein] hydrolase